MITLDEGEPIRPLARLLEPKVAACALRLALQRRDVAGQLLAKIDEISRVFWETNKR